VDVVEAVTQAGGHFPRGDLPGVSRRGPRGEVVHTAEGRGRDAASRAYDPGRGEAVVKHVIGFVKRIKGWWDDKTSWWSYFETFSQNHPWSRR
jgi:hypothetical protein